MPERERHHSVMPGPCLLCGGPTALGLRLPGARLAASDLARDLDIAVCAACGFAFQAGADTPEYGEFIRHAYEAWDDKPLFDFPRRSQDNVAAAEIIARHSGRQARVLEIGSNRGDILALVKERMPEASILGVDPATHKNLPVPTLRAFFDPALFSSRFDTVILKQVLEHFADPAPMLAGARAVLEDGGLLYLEVPNLTRILEGRTDAFILEHTAYYTLSTLRAALSGFEIIEAQEAGSLRVAARKLPGKTAPARFVPPADGPRQAKEALEGLARLGRGRERGKELLVAHAAAGGRVLFFGAYNCFRALYRELSPLLAGCPCVVADDAMQGDREPVFGLPRVAGPEKGDLVLLCSNNAEVLDRMWERTAGQTGQTEQAGGGFAVIRPWSALLRADGTTSDLGADT
ncbi:MAG TPA: class I SAM-dependent methyltransferase [Humidesulfovibrio sp.]|uniref:class I SAM-dependent methyltransferase n=1 Tax=Humidesulfovibrio sp. TaxID=2910988 RepID=UPI002BE112F3|nr:class I SAM-dependent methyltransferase [Humidesulfovibrio sp.]HWR03259.1 class I SAM-dependent methyltransferase [Humidesulfovibrio sp.]